MSLTAAPGAPAETLVDAFDLQIEWCTQLESPFMVRLLGVVRGVLLAEPALAARVLAEVPAPRSGLLPLRLAGALHDLALRGRRPWALLWPDARNPSGAESPDAALGIAVHRAFSHEWPHLQRFLASAPQTNEVRRSAVLLPGWLWVASRTGLPLALLEVGASAGLNLWADRWQHRHADWHWPGESNGVVLETRRSGPPPPSAALRIASRQACDLFPVDLADLGEQRRLAAYVWPDQRERLTLLRAALAEAALWKDQDGVRIEALGAADFAQLHLAAPREGCATLLYHSVVWQYLPEAERQRLVAVLEDAGRRAHAGAPLAWLRYEMAGGEKPAELRCRLWPGGEDHLLAVAHPHGAWIEWRAVT